MKDFNFNPYAMVAPCNPQEYLALLDEAIDIIEYIGEQIDQDTIRLEQKEDNG